MGMIANVLIKSNSYFFSECVGTPKKTRRREKKKIANQWTARCAWTTRPFSAKKTFL